MFRGHLVSGVSGGRKTNVCSVWVERERKVKRRKNKTHAPLFHRFLPYCIKGFYEIRYNRLMLQKALSSFIDAIRKHFSWNRHRRVIESRIIQFQLFFLHPNFVVIIPLLDELDSVRPRVTADDGQFAADETHAGHHSATPVQSSQSPPLILSLPIEELDFVRARRASHNQNASVAVDAHHGASVLHFRPRQRRQRRPRFSVIFFAGSRADFGQPRGFHFAQTERCAARDHDVVVDGHGAGFVSRAR